MHFERLPIAALLAAAIVLAVELVGVSVVRHLALTDLWLHSSPGRDDPLRFAAQLHLADSSKRLVYVLGSSQARSDVDPRSMQELLSDAGITDAEVWNLAVDGADAIDAFVQLDAIAEKQPRLVAMIPTWVFFYDDYDPTKLELYPTTLARLRDTADLYGERSFWRDTEGELSSAVLANLVPSFRWARSYLSTPLIGAVLGEDRAAPRLFMADSPHGEDYFRETIAKHGWRRGVTLDTLRKRRALAAFARELRSRDIRLVVIEGPLHPRAEEMRPAFLVIWEDYVTNMRRLAADLDFTYVENDACGVEDAALFNDFGHLNTRGREVFTECVSRVLLPHLR